ncbi:hypothetical protein WJX74_008443 [Apatococcus lobatus]|uniref:N-acetyltransferase domain-containing protein n=1 Tax=Apatococcus lobatus TaxID=904363 RepID=A0AAW1RVW1_9CHLO
MSGTAPILHTGPLVLRLLQPADAPALCCLAADKRIAATTISVPHPYTQHHAESFIQHAQQEYSQGASVIFAVTASSWDGASARGQLLSLTRKAGGNQAELGYWIGVPHWRQGFAQLAAKAVVEYAFGTLKLARLHANCFASNTASSKVLAKVGMHREFLLAKSHEKWGVLQDEEFWCIDAP